MGASNSISSTPDARPSASGPAAGGEAAGLVPSKTTGPAFLDVSFQHSVVQELRIGRLRRTVWACGHLHRFAAPKGFRENVWFCTLTYKGVDDWQPGHISRCRKAVRKWCKRRSVPFRYVWVTDRARQDRCAKKEHGQLPKWAFYGLSDQRIDDHLDGRMGCGIGFINPGQSTTRLALLDLDSHNGETSFDEMLQTADRLCAALEAVGFSRAVGDSLKELQVLDLALDAINAKYGQSKADRAGKYSRPGEGPNNSVLTKDDMKGVDNSALFSLEQKRNAGTLSKDDLGTAQGAFNAAAANLDVFQKNWSVFSLEGAKSIQDTFTASRAILERVKAMDGRPGTTGSGNSTTVNINIGGRSTAVNVASQSDANSLTSVLRQLESSKGVSA